MITLEAEFGGHVARIEAIRDGYNTVLEIFKGILACYGRRDLDRRLIVKWKRNKVEKWGGGLKSNVSILLVGSE